MSGSPNSRWADHEVQETRVLLGWRRAPQDRGSLLQCSWGRATTVATSLVAVVCLLKVSQQPSRQHPPGVDNIILEDSQTGCSPEGQNCTASKCCKTPGFRCFKKSDQWAACKPWCEKGPDPYDWDAVPWECSPLGPFTKGKAPPWPNAHAQPKPWVQSKCAGPSEDCSEKACCKEAGKQCFRKHKGWAGCKLECVQGPDPVDADNDSWGCDTIGMKTPGFTGAPGGVAAKWVAETCADKYENCLHNRCCKDAGYQCFLKQGEWAMCLTECIHGPLLTDANADIWNCTALGGRTPGLVPAVPKRFTAAWVKTNCSSPDQNCSNTMCCKDHTLQCYKKDDKWASCKRSCKPGVHKGDSRLAPWHCDQLGPRTPRKWISPTLYCFSVIRLHSEEESILKAQVRTDGGAGIFSCDQSDVFAADGRAFIGDGPEGPVWTEHFTNAVVTRSVDNTAGNTMLFRNVWKAVHTVGRWNFTDWTIKVDPDAVIFGDRLREHLVNHSNGQPVFVENCQSGSLVQQGGHMMFGSLEAISHAGISKYMSSGEWKCNKNYQYGEDRWLGLCLQELGVTSFLDPRILGDKLCVPGVWSCTDGRAAYHHYKTKDTWLDCYFKATGRPSLR